MTDLTLEEKIHKLYASQEIKNLKAQYCAYCDDNYNPDGLAGLFTKNAVWDGGPEFGRHSGREAIRDFFAAVSGNILFAAHLVMNPIIEVSGNRATGQWRLIMSKYDEEYEFCDSKWLFSKMTVESQFYCGHQEGWAQDTI